MKYSIDKQAKYVIVQPHEEKIDAALAPELKTLFINLAAEGNKSFILNMVDVKYVDSSGLSAVLFGNRLANEQKGSFVLSNIGDHVMKLIRISQLDRVLDIYPSTETGIDAVLLDHTEKNLKTENEE
ncbi:MAG: anti-sigma factor antagonist [Bacteroidetes bacterium]|nr:MAG: anti-sigma factor antagonist [Bacteroidota bacterium]TAG89595.1 MAG: anti-sigma factor antagonist [Bacteroidota bacterium]